MTIFEIEANGYTYEFKTSDILECIIFDKKDDKDIPFKVVRKKWRKDDGCHLTTEASFLKEGKEPTKKISLEYIFDHVLEEKKHHSVPNFKWGENGTFVQEWAYLGRTCLWTWMSLKCATGNGGRRLIGKKPDDEFNNLYVPGKNDYLQRPYPLNDGESRSFAMNK